MRIAIVTQGFSTGGGVASIARWLREGLTMAGHSVDVHDLAASRRDVRSRRVAAPRTWRAELAAEANGTDIGLFHWGANWVEFEGQRYRPRLQLTSVLDAYDLIQVVAGGPALALATSESSPPKALQVATTLLLELPSQLPRMVPMKRVLKTLSLRALHRLEVKGLRAMDHVFVENRYMEQWVREHGQPHVTFAPPGIDTDTFGPMGAWDPRRPIIAFGRLGDSRKDWPTAVEAYERLVAATGLGNRLVLAGKGPLAPALIAKLRASPVRNRIDVRENVPAGELPGLLASGSVFLQSSLEEGLGLAGLEAMACGLPVVATRTVGSAEYVRDGENGYLVELGPDTARDLAMSLSRALRPEAATMSVRAVSTCSKEYSSSASLGRFLNTYTTLIRNA